MSNIHLTAGEQEFYAEKGFVNEPQRCKDAVQAQGKSEASVRFTQPFALLTGNRVPFKPVRTVRFFAASLCKEEGSRREALGVHNGFGTLVRGN